MTGIPSATLAHIHSGPITGTGGVVFDLLGSKQLTPASPLIGTLAISEAVNVTDTTTLLPALFNGGLYVNVHTATNRGGELRGQLGPATTRLTADLSGANEVPARPTAATGAASVNLSLESGQLEFAVAVTGITSKITMAHIHEGAPGSNGPVILDLLAAGGGRFSDGTTLRGTVFLTTTQQISKALNSQYYVNVHSQSFPGGEVRGQLAPQQQFLTYDANLSGANEVPSVPSQGSGRALMTFDTSTNRLAYSVTVANISSTVTLAHIHAAPVGVNGPVIFDLLGNKTLAAGTPLTGALQLNAFAFDTLNSGGYYVNVHSQTFKSGEVRGQLSPDVPTAIFLPLIDNPAASPGKE